MAALWSGGVNVGARGPMRATYPFLFMDDGTWFSCLRFKLLFTCIVEYTLHMYVFDYDRPEFRDEIPFKEGRM